MPGPGVHDHAGLAAHPLRLLLGHQQRQLALDLVQPDARVQLGLWVGARDTPGTSWPGRSAAVTLTERVRPTLARLRAAVTLCSARYSTSRAPRRLRSGGVRVNITPAVRLTVRLTVAPRRVTARRNNSA
ncbi:hypothetical protein GCM10029964_013110 [Kibdelosporangium lantanae]